MHMAANMFHSEIEQKKEVVDIAYKIYLVMGVPIWGTFEIT